MTDSNRRVFSPLQMFITLILTCCSGAGCFVAATDSEEHLEHRVPAHKPTNWVDALKQLELRTSKILQPSKQFHSAPDKTTQELLDIIRWLSEFAADTDMKKVDWDLVFQTAPELERLVTEGQQQSPSSRAIFHQKFQQKLSALKELPRNVKKVAGP